MSPTPRAAKGERCLVCQVVATKRAEPASAFFGGYVARCVEETNDGEMVMREAHEAMRAKFLDANGLELVAIPDAAPPREAMS